MSEPFVFPTPWSVADHAGRISIVASDGKSVIEVYPGQHLGEIPSTEVCRRVADLIVARVNGETP
jgi:hypothetical protein